MGTASINQETSNQIRKTDGDNKYRVETACVLVLVVNVQTLYVEAGIREGFNSRCIFQGSVNRWIAGTRRAMAV